jgi:hypothetical protein
LRLARAADGDGEGKFVEFAVHGASRKIRRIRIRRIRTGRQNLRIRSLEITLGRLSEAGFTTGGSGAGEGLEAMAQEMEHGPVMDRQADQGPEGDPDAERADHMATEAGRKAAVFHLRQYRQGSGPCG